MNLFFNFYSISSISAAAFTLFAAMYFLISVRRRSRATVHLGVALLLLGIAHIAYSISASWYHPYAAYHRYLTVSLIPGGAIHFLQMFMHYPRTTKLKPVRWFLYVHWLVNAILILWFIAVTYNGPYRFRFSTHYWDFADRQVSAVIALFILVSVLLAPVVTAVRSFYLDRSTRRTLIILCGFYLGAVLVPAIANRLSHTGVIDRGTFQLIYNMMSILGFFFVIVLYMNRTNERSSVMARLIGVSLVFFILIFQWLSYFSHTEAESAYDQSRYLEAKLAGSGKIEKNVSYLIKFNKNTGEVYEQKQFGKSALQRNLFENEERIRPYQEYDNDSLRVYRTDSQNRRYLSYFVAEGEIITEAGFLYSDYRQYQHGYSVKHAVLFFTGLLVIALGFRFFFAQSITGPLLNLVKGMGKVNSGALDTRVHVEVHDEIGFLTHSFNRMVSSVRIARRKLEEFAESLEAIVKLRTEELEQSLEQINTMKSRQDGDFYLASLLIHPLSSNGVHSDSLEIDFAMRQLKQFKFKRWEGEIGGDFCSAHSITLGDRKMAVFINADAMGKSLQGAAGALIVGSVFESMVQRTRIDPPSSNTMPEIWLRNAYLELQKIFLTFEGYMMVSMILGLIDESTGCFYYINAEHPLAILYKNEKAAFLKHDNASTYKLGVHNAENRFRVTVNRLTPGDILIVGSDGRDDVVTAVDLKGNRLINDSEERILSIVETSGGNLQEIIKNLVDYSELKDDLSLLRVLYIGNDRSVSEEEAADHRQLAIQYKENRDFRKAAVHMKELTALQPWRNDYLYQTSYFYKKAGLYETALMYGLSMQIRDPEHLNNNINLADLYRLTGRDEAARTLLDSAMKIEPDHQAANKLAGILKLN